MGLLQKKPQITNSAPFYRLGPSKNYLIIGLGNPEKKYLGTRHNIGFAAVDNLATKLDFPKWSAKKDLQCLLTDKIEGDSKVILIKPTTYMNLSGEAAIKVAKFYKIPDTQIVAVYDELDVPFGQIRTRVGGTSAGHNGVKSLIEHLGEGFGRVRIGIQNDHSGSAESADFVLAEFNKAEKSELSNLLQELNSILSEYIYRGELISETRSFII